MPSNTGAAAISCSASFWPSAADIAQSNPGCTVSSSDKPLRFFPIRGPATNRVLSANSIPRTNIGTEICHLYTGPLCFLLSGLSVGGFSAQNSRYGFCE
jgi:hypothetical protein